MLRSRTFLPTCNKALNLAEAVKRHYLPQHITYQELWWPVSSLFVYLSYSSMTLRNVNLCSYVSNCYLYACLILLINVDQYLATQIVFSAAQLLGSITYISDYSISAQIFLPVHKSLLLKPIVMHMTIVFIHYIIYYVH